MRTINPIKKALVARLVAAQETLKLKSVKADISPQDIVEAIKEELPSFPGVLVTYAGRTARREGSLPGGSMLCDPTYALFVADQKLSGPFVSGETCIDLIEDLVELLDGLKVSNLQRTAFEFVSDQLMYQDASLVIYQLLFRTQTVHARR